MALRSMGATSSSFMKPNSRSHAMPIAAKVDVKCTDMLTMPGYLNCV